MGKYDEFDLDIKEVKANSSKGTARSTWGCVEKSIQISQFVTNALSCQSCECVQQEVDLNVLHVQGQVKDRKQDVKC